VISEEIPRIQRLRDAGEMDYCFLASNRRRTGVAALELAFGQLRETLDREP